MLRSSLVLSLLFATASACAQDSCTVTGGERCKGAASEAREPVEQSGAAPPRSSVARSKYAKPTAAPSGGGTEEVLPRGRASKWHSLLPGMFR